MSVIAGWTRGTQGADARGVPGLPDRTAGVPAALEPGALNGVCVGPNLDPDRFMLLGPGLQGGEGVTWRARYSGALKTPLEYAVKQMLRPEGVGPLWPTHDDRKRWHDQRHLLASVRNDHLVTVHDFFFGPPPHAPGACAPVDGREFAVPYLVMEFVEGRTLDASVRQGEGSLVARLQHVRDLADGLSALHSTTRTSGNPMLHRDIKPSNCVLNERRGGVLVDFGTLRTVDDGYDARGMHTRHYTAPEALVDPSAPRDAATDLYALGAVAWFCVVGEDPPAADERRATALLRSELAAAVVRWGVVRAKELVEHLLQMLATDPRSRPSRPAPWAEQLLVLAGAPAAPGPASLSPGSAGRVRRRAQAVTAAAVGAVALGAGVITWHPDDEPSGSVVPAVFTPFGRSFADFAATAQGSTLRITPPGGRDRFAQLWGFHAPGNGCATRVSFDAEVGPHGPNDSFGYAVAPRSSLDDDQPQGDAVQYEWEAADVNPRVGSYLRPAQLPGGAWRIDEAEQAQPLPAPDITQRRHVVVRAVGATMTVSVDGEQQARYRLSRTSCGGVTLRAWGAPVTFENVRVEQT